MINNFKRIINVLKLRIGIKLYNYGYTLISNSVVRLNKGIHPKHKIMRYHDFFVENISSRDNVLDIGCGNGALAFDVAKKAKFVTGIDIKKSNIDFANIHYVRPNLEFKYADARFYNPKITYHIIILSNVIEHLADRVKFLKKIMKLSKQVLIRVPLITRGWLPVYLKREGYEYRLDSTHYIEYDESTIVQEIERAGLIIEKSYVKWGEWYGICKKK